MHGVASGHLLTLIASARLHKLDPEVYLRDVFRVLPHWPRDAAEAHATRENAKFEMTSEAQERVAQAAREAGEMAYVDAVDK